MRHTVRRVATEEQMKCLSTLYSQLVGHDFVPTGRAVNGFHVVSLIRKLEPAVARVSSFN